MSFETYKRQKLVQLKKQFEMVSTMIEMTYEGDEIDSDMLDSAHEMAEEAFSTLDSPMMDDF